MKDSEIAKALESTLISPNVNDSNMEAANVVDALAYIGKSIRAAATELGHGDAATSMGAIEAHGKAITDAADKIAMAIGDLAEAIRSSSE